MNHAYVTFETYNFPFNSLESLMCISEISFLFTNSESALELTKEDILLYIILQLSPLNKALIFIQHF